MSGEEILSGVQQATGHTLDALLGPLDSLSPWYGLLASSVAFAGVVVLAYALISDQQAIARSRQRILAALLSMVIYAHEARAAAGGLVAVPAALLGYLAASVKPLAAISILAIPAFGHLETRYGREPLAPGARTLLSVELADFALHDRIRLDAGPQIAVEAAVAVPEENALVWRIRVGEAGVHTVHVGAPGTEPLAKRIGAAPGRAVPARRSAAGRLWRRITDPNEPPIPRDAPVREIEVDHPPRRLWLGETPLAWPVPFVALALAFSWALASLFGLRL